MPVNQFITTEYRSKGYNDNDYLSNPLDFAVNFVGNVMRPTQAIINIFIDWYSQSDTVNTWNIKATSIERTTGSFFDDGFWQGQKFASISDYSLDNTSPIEFEAVIDSISTDGLIINFTVTAGAVTPDATASDYGIRAIATAPENELTALLYQFGFIETNEPFNTVSKIAGVNNRYQTSAIGVGGSTAVVDMFPQGTVLSWQTGSAKAQFVANTAYTKNYKITHEFIISPWFLEGQRNDIESLVPPDYFIGSNCLNHVFDIEFRPNISEPQKTILARRNLRAGFTGWLDENFNGLTNDYTVNSIAYSDTATAESRTALQTTFRTSVEIEIERNSGNFVAGNRVGFFISYLAPQTEYETTGEDAKTAFLYDSIYHEDGQGIVTAGGIIKEIDSSISASLLTITVELEYTAEQANKINNGSYMIALDVSNIALDNQNSNSITLLVDIQSYGKIPPIESLIIFNSFDVVSHDLTVETSPQLWNEDGIYIGFSFDLDLNKEAFLRDITFSLVAYNTITGESFSLDSFIVDTSGATISSGVQQIEIDTTRNYILTGGDIFNAVQISTGVLIGSLQGYTGVFAQKIRWQDWLKNIGADPAFYNLLEPQNNLNFKSSNYSGFLDYEIRVQAIARTFGIDNLGISGSGLDTEQSTDLIIRDYEEEVGGWSAIISLHDPDTLADTNGVILSAKDTIFRVTWQNSISGNDLSGLYAIHRMQESFSVGSDISELSSIRSRLVGDVIKPLSGETLLKISQLAPDFVVTECLIDKGKINQSSSYNLSYKLERK